uniref:C-type lectin domain-containing protein n=1 Tax=Oryzias latipes TaxID=8090 RepID=A0A3P9KSA3_ORYLA
MSARPPLNCSPQWHCHLRTSAGDCGRSCRCSPMCEQDWGEHSPLRYPHQNKKNYVFINQAMSWSSAQQYCRKNYKDVAMIENQEENTEAQNAKPSSDVVWIGLYREPWTWSDGSKSSFRNWNDSYLNNYADKQHCGIENSDHNWDDLNCGMERVFVCHQGEHLKKY